MQSNKNAIALAAIILIVLVGGWYVGRHYVKTGAPAQTASSTAIDLGSISTTTTVGGYTITPIYGTTGSAPAAPDYKKPIAFSADISADVKTAIQAQFADVESKLSANADDYDSWMRLATLHKMAGDYQGAAAIWAYAAVHWNDYLAYANLGNLYMYNLKDYAKAEANYKKAVALKPDFIEGYGTLATLYSSFGYKGSMTAAQIIDQGLKANPNNPTLLQLKSQLSSQ